MEFFEGPDKKRSLFESRAEQRTVFFLVFMGVVTITYGFFYLIDFLPEKPAESGEDAHVTEDTEMHTRTDAADAVAAPPVSEEPIDPFPETIILDTLDREIPVLNPTSLDIEALDAALLSGAVRYPGSADFEHTGIVFLFGHSSYLPNVINKNFQAFNGIQKLTWGDKIRLRSSDTEYVYRVDRVYETKASAAEVEIETGEPKLVLATCNSFGSKDDRFVVEATLVSQKGLQ